MTVGLLGGSGEPAPRACDHVLLVPDTETARIQECHIALGHAVLELLEDRLVGRPRRDGPASPGAAGFIGYHVAEALLARGDRVVGIDNLNAYYDVRLKQARLAAAAAARPASRSTTLDVVGSRGGARPGAIANPDIDAASCISPRRPGVRHSLVDPYAYVQSNVMGHLVMLEAARHCARLRHFVYASTSSVYGANRSLPFRETDRVDHADVAVCGDQAGGRTDEPRLCAPVRAAADRAAVFHGLRAMGPAGHGVLQLRPGDRRPASRSRCTTAAGCGATSPISTTSWRASWAASTGRRRHAPPARVLNIGNHRSEEVRDPGAPAGGSVWGGKAVIRVGAAADRWMWRRRSPRWTRLRADRVRAEDAAWRRGFRGSSAWFLGVACCEAGTLSKSCKNAA